MRDLDNFEKEYPMQFNHASDVIDKLKSLPRTGWLQWNIDKTEAETVYDHIREVRMYAVGYQSELGLSDGETKELIDMLEIHDWPEALVGDGVILGDEVNVDKLRDHKAAREMEAMVTICESLPEGDYILSLYKRYSDQSDNIAQLAKQIEKVQAVFKAVEYEKKFNKKGLTEEFVHYTKDLISNDFLVHQMNKSASKIVSLLVFMTGVSSVFISVFIVLM